jgi:chorismate mutase/prephenate dehydratase
MTLDALRNNIDSVDDRILSLLEERANLVDEVAKTKRKSAEAAGAAAGSTATAPNPNVRYYDPERERRVLDRLATRGAGRFPREAIRVVFREVMSACLSLEEPLRVAFMGPEGTWSQVAAHHLFGLAARYRETMTIEGVFDAVRAGDAACGVVPVENSTEGGVTFTADALIEGDLVIQQECVLEVAQCLLSRSTSLSGVKRVYSHPQALAQCRQWLFKNLPGAELVQTTSTVVGAHEALGDDGGAVIGSPLAGELYGLPVLRERVQDRPENATRFVVIAKEDAKRTGHDKTSLAFSLRDEKGALRRVLTVLEDLGLNLSRIESRPSRQKAWDYVFLVDLEGHRDDAPVKTGIAQLTALCAMVKVLGSYPRARSPLLPGAAAPAPTPGSAPATP